MTTSQLEQCTGQIPSSAGRSTRYAIEQPEVGWKRLAISRVMPLLNGRLCFSELANRVIRTASARVLLSNRKVVEVLSIEISEYKMDAEGAVDQVEFGASLAHRLDDGYIRPDLTPSAADVEAIKRCFGIAFSEI